MFGILNAFYNAISSFISLWLQTGLTKYCAEFKTDFIKKQKIYSFSLLIGFFLSIVSLIILLLFQNRIIIIFFNNQISKDIYLIFVFSIFNFTIKPLLFSVYQGLFEYKKIIIFKIVFSFVELVAIIILTWFLGINGFFLSFTVIAIISTFTIWFNLHKLFNNKFCFPKFHEELSKNLLRYGTYHLVLVFITYALSFYQRKLLLDYTNLSVIGIFSVGSSMAGYLNFLPRAAGMQYFPEISSIKNDDSTKNILSSYIRFITLIQLPFAFILILNAEILINIFYTSKFLNLKPTLFLFIVNIVLTSFADALQTYIVVQGKLFIHTIISILFVVISGLLTITLVKEYYIVGILWAMIFGSLFRVVSYTIVTKKLANLRMDSFYPIILGLIMIITVNYFQDMVIIIKVMIYLISLYFIYSITNTTERKQILSLFRKFINV